MGIATDAIAEGRVVETGIPAPLDRLPWSRWYGRRHHLFGKLVESGETSQVLGIEAARRDVEQIATPLSVHDGAAPSGALALVRTLGRARPGGLRVRRSSSAAPAVGAERAG